MIQVAFQGERGAYSESAAMHFWNQDVEPVPCPSFRKTFEAVSTGRVPFGIIPIENSLAGSVHQNVDLLLEFDLTIVGEIVLRIHHHLMAVPGASLKTIRRVRSHPQALGQCDGFLRSLPDVDVIPEYDTAGAAKWVAEKGRPEEAAIASARAAEDYELTILKSGIEDLDVNFTRFLIMAPRPEALPEKGKTSIVYSAKDQPGALFKSLSVFALRDINLLKIESRPLRQGPWKYYFYLDFEGVMTNPVCQNAVRHLEEVADFIKVLGSYPVGEVIQ